ncbi:hypothetical protein A946_04700 [Methylacidiphilum kamchatkense Kam1]|uniref:Uncharacterized protein n=1 Tax=Methylacidiphilum kamchatkense Kam1 TaxID=1202785 RepID=A0A0C1V4U1_9BACT|nr:hypothetical protein A946_04700 [Methylacidiphilum kamchatkense Kam1]QDQ41875.1 hypothetical protein kam1_627 [Methylacidiphilum kamchatkense Kam1]
MLRNLEAAKVSGKSNINYYLKVFTYSCSKEIKLLFCFFADDLGEGSTTKSPEFTLVKISQLTDSSG